MAATWPISLQQKISVAGFGIQFGDTTIRTDMDIGPAKVRRRTTKAVDVFDCSIDLDFDQYNTFYSFYDVTLNGGVNRFEFPHPITGAITEFRFAAPPRVVPKGNGGRAFVLTMQWEALP